MSLLTSFSSEISDHLSLPDYFNKMCAFGRGFCGYAGCRVCRVPASGAVDLALLVTEDQSMTRKDCIHCFLA